MEKAKTANMIYQEPKLISINTIRFFILKKDVSSAIRLIR